MIKDKSMGRKLIFLDIDGTLLPPGEMTVPASAVEAIRQARCCRRVICSSRKALWLHWIAPEQTDTSCFCVPAATTA